MGEQGYDAIFISSKDLADKIPNLGGLTPSNYSLLPHQDHLPNDKKRFLGLSKTDYSSRGSKTYIVSSDLVKEEIDTFIQYFNENIEDIRECFKYSPSFKITEEQALRCFNGELEEVIKEYLGEEINEENLLFARSGILNYLIQGDHTNRLVDQFISKYENSDMLYVHEWDEPGILIIDNSKVFHGRIGNNSNPIKRNWFI